MQLYLLDKPFDPWQWLADYQQNHLVAHRGKYGANTVFIGTMRDFNESSGIETLFLEHYPGMTERALEKILSHAQAQWDLQESVIVHRVGWIVPNEAIVLVAVWSSHRKEAFESCRYLIEELKSKAPFWKKEVFKQGDSHWVTHNTPG